MQNNLEGAFAEIVRICAQIDKVQEPIGAVRGENIEYIKTQARAKLREYEEAPFFLDLFSETMTHMAGLK